MEKMLTACFCSHCERFVTSEEIQSDGVLRIQSVDMKGAVTAGPDRFHASCGTKLRVIEPQNN